MRKTQDDISKNVFFNSQLYCFHHNFGIYVFTELITIHSGTALEFSHN